MVRNDIQNQPHPRLFQRRRHAVKPFPPANRRVNFEYNEKLNRFLEGTGSIIFDHQHQLAYACLSPRTDATYRQLAAVLADGGRAAELGRIRCPTLVLHGAADPWVPPACGRDTARRIPGARLVMVPDMAHDLVPAGHPEIVRRVLAVLLPFLQSAHPADPTDPA